MAVDFKQDTMTAAMTASLIIQQQNEILNEALTELAGDFGVSKSIAKKIIVAFSKDTLEKTGEKMEDERNSLISADVMIEACENMSFDPDEALEEAGLVTSDDED